VGSGLSVTGSVLSGVFAVLSDSSQEDNTNDKAIRKNVIFFMIFVLDYNKSQILC
jgi:hypothetical protein